MAINVALLAWSTVDISSCTTVDCLFFFNSLLLPILAQLLPTTAELSVTELHTSLAVSFRMLDSLSDSSWWLHKDGCNVQNCSHFSAFQKPCIGCQRLILIFVISGFWMSVPAPLLPSVDCRFFLRLMRKWKHVPTAYHCLGIAVQSDWLCVSWRTKCNLIEKSPLVSAH